MKDKNGIQLKDGDKIKADGKMGIYKFFVGSVWPGVDFGDGKGYVHLKDYKVVIKI